MALNVALLPGDGIGPEVTAEAARLLTRVAELYHHPIRLSTHPVGGEAIEATGQPLPPSTLEAEPLSTRGAPGTFPAQPLSRLR